MNDFNLAEHVIPQLGSRHKNVEEFYSKITVVWMYCSNRFLFLSKTFYIIIVGGCMKCSNCKLTFNKYFNDRINNKLFKML